MIVLQQVITGPEPCVYLPDQQATLEHRLVARLSAAEYEGLLARGWRKFGPALFRPICPTCRACRPLRIPAARFAPDRSQRRCATRNADLSVTIQTPTIDEDRLALYNRYHIRQETIKGWPSVEKTAADYHFAFLDNPVPACEIAVWDGDRLRGIALADLTREIVSGVYHFYDPDHADRSLGTFLMLQVIALARTSNRTWAHFGYWVADCPSLAYKSRFRPCEVLGEDGLWHPLGPDSSSPSFIEGPEEEATPKPWRS